MNYHPSFHPGNVGENIPPIAFSPNGDWIFSAEDLPILPPPRFVRVTPETFEIDGWVLLLFCVTKSKLRWIQATFVRWNEADATPENRNWTDGMLDAIREVVEAKLQEEQEPAQPDNGRIDFS